MQNKAGQAARDGREWIVPMARAGYAAKGAVYVLVGILAFMSAFGLGGSVGGAREALEALQPKTFGTVLLALIAAGLACYSVWRLVQSICDPEDRGNDAKALAARTGLAFSGVVHLGLAWATVQMIRGQGGSGGNAEEGWTAKLLAQPFGVWLVGLVGAVVAGVAVYQIYRGVSGRFKKRLVLSELNGKVRQQVCRVCQFGLVARGLSFAIIAWFFIRAAIHYNAQESGGLREALGALAAQPYGPWLLGAMGLGLASYGVFAFVEAKFRRILGHA